MNKKKYKIYAKSSINVKTVVMNLDFEELESKAKTLWLKYIERYKDSSVKLRKDFMNVGRALEKLSIEKKKAIVALIPNPNNILNYENIIEMNNQYPHYFYQLMDAACSRSQLTKNLKKNKHVFMADSKID